MHQGEELVGALKLELVKHMDDLRMDAVKGAVGILISKLGELLKKEYNLQAGVPEKIRSLVKELECAHVALRKVAGVPPDQLDEQVRIWASEVREASYDMEDVLDTFLNMVVSGPLKRRKISTTIHDIDKRLEEVTQRHRRYTADSIVAKPSPTTTIDPRLAAMYKEVTQLVGIDKSSSELISMLSPLGDSDETKKKMKMVSVFGAGGLGKTTLAKAVYDKLKDNFECSAFVPVGRNSDLKKVFRDILIEIDKTKYMDRKITILDERQLIDELRQYLRNKRYFIIIDDIWETKLWETIKLALVQNNTGSRLITTTRMLEVAKEADEVYKLQQLPYDKSKKLFYMRIFGDEGKCLDNQLVEVSHKVLKKCDGIPLAIITMASLLMGKSREQWIEVCNSVVFRDKENKQVSDTEWILSLSYYDLPPHLKTCLLYISAFPEDYFIYKDMLIRKWVAEGFVHGKYGTRMFKVGEGYFNDLINRSMIQGVESEENGIVYGCRIHDMVLDFLRVKSQEENFVNISSTNSECTSSPSTVRRLAHQNRTVEQTHQDTQIDLQRIRTFIACSCNVYPGLSFLSFKLLRVLALEGCGGWERNPPSPIHLKHLESLLHLRYLGLMRTCIHELPEEIGALKFLQTLDLELASATKHLPSSIYLLTQLICLRAGYMMVPNAVLGKLTSLEELQINICDSSMMQDLGKLPELRVLEARFELTDINTQRDLVESIGRLHKIQHLELKQYGNPWFKKILWDTVVLPRPLQCLIIPDTVFSTLPSCIGRSDLLNLSRLELRVSRMDEQGLKILGSLPELHHLRLETWSTVRVTIHDANESLFRRLRSLLMPRSIVWFLLNEDSSVSFIVGLECDGSIFGTKKRDECIVVPHFMPNLQVLQFLVHVWSLMHNNNSCDNLGLEYLRSLQKVILRFYCHNVYADEVEREEAALMHAIESHPNRPTFKMEILGKDFMMRCVLPAPIDS
ncbi:hypothetical protein EJB05_25710, partial [Eragrostis curvula]